MADTLIGGRYRTLERHAVGGMATLWRARDERTGEMVALKRLHPYLVADPRARARLVREAAALKAIDHPAITRPREVIDDPDDPALVMDFAEGRSLRDRLAAEGALHAEEAVAIAGTVADALAVAHDAGIVHRDIKPGNILVEETGAVHLVDFGIATVDDGSADLTATGTVVGTARYAAPERLLGGESTPRSDVWSLGAVLYEMLTGRAAVDGDGTARSTEAGGAAPDTDGLPAGLASVVGRSMAADPADRYPDAAAFRDAVFSPEANDDPRAVTAVVPLPHGVAGPPAGSAQRRRIDMSPVDRAAAIFFGGVGVVTLAAVVVLGLGGAGQATGPSPSPHAPAIEVAPGPTEAVAPSPTEAVATPPPDDDDEGRGRGNGGGGGNGRGRGNDGGGD